ncbi:protein-glutamate O-methyltransferase CheR [Ruminococcaceae bacterium OttesenSCG-928-I18]|nr:protein-glutamate O-methyltransferase CheR [Ruminococcaceae bacterium OttesenSCG-928-I18]
MIQLTDKEFTELRDYVLSNYGIDLSKKRMLIQGRLTNTLTQKGFTTFTEYINLVKQDSTGTELQQMLNKLTTNLTYFLREREHFDFLTNVALPEFEQKFKGRQLRIWSAGCSSGEEPYTLAMTLSDFFATRGGDQRFVILASDISQNVLGQAQRGIYTSDGLKDVPKSWLTKYFEKLDGGDYKVKENIKGKITFRTFNLMDPFRFKKPFELIFCRNVMIYFDKQKKDELIGKFYTWTAPGGYFFVSHSENIGRTDTGFKMVRPSTFKKEG